MYSFFLDAEFKSDISFQILYLEFDNIRGQYKFSVIFNRKLCVNNIPVVLDALIIIFPYCFKQISELSTIERLILRHSLGKTCPL